MADTGGTIYFGGGYAGAGDNSNMFGQNDPAHGNAAGENRFGEPNSQDADMMGGHSSAHFPKTLMDAKGIFRAFVKGYQQDGGFLYMKQLAQNWASGHYLLEFYLQHLDGFGSGGEQLAHAIRRQPLKYIGPCEAALQDIYGEHVDHLLKSAQDGNANGVTGLGGVGTPAGPTQSGNTADHGGAANIDGFGTRKDLPRFQLVVKSDEAPLRIRALKSSFVEKLVCITGIVIQASLPDHKAYSVRVRCKKCGNSRDIFLNVSVGRSKALIPRTCSNDPGGDAKCGLDPYIIVAEECKYVDVQHVKLQELPEDVPVGETPRTVPLTCVRYLSGKLCGGKRVKLVGVFSADERSGGDGASGLGGDKRDPTVGGLGGGSQVVKTSVVQVLGFFPLDDGGLSSGNRLTPQEEEKFLAFSRSGASTVRSTIYRSIAPAIRASKKDCVDDIRAAIACVMFGGSRKQLPDGTRLRGDINCLLVGDPGTAKSQFLKFVEKAAPIVVYTSGKGSSAAGLTAAIVRDASGRFALEGGAMVLADGGIVCIDEFDKMRADDRVAIHEAMEQQTISISKAGITTVLNTRCAILAAANPIFGSWNTLEDTAAQMDFATTILSRFDLIFLVKDVRDMKRDLQLARHVVALHATAGSTGISAGLTGGVAGGRHASGSIYAASGQLGLSGGLSIGGGAAGSMPSGSNISSTEKSASAQADESMEDGDDDDFDSSKNNNEPMFTVEDLRKYLYLAKSRCDPRLSEGAATLLQNHYVKIRAQAHAERMSKKGNTVPITVRQLEALARISEALARMELSNDVLETHAQEAIRLFTLSTLDAANKQVGGGGSLSEDDKKVVFRIEDAIRRLVHIKGRKKKTTLMSELQHVGSNNEFPEHLVLQALNTMTLRGELEQFGSDSVVRVR